MRKCLKLVFTACLYISSSNLFISCSSSDTPETSSVPVIVPETAVTVRIATYNVHNFFDTICDSRSCGYNSYEPNVSQTQYDLKVNQVATGIWTLDADIILLQEIEKESCLVDVQNRLSASKYPGIAFGETGRSASVDVGILTRGTINNVQKHSGGYRYTQEDGTIKPLARELLQADITLPNGREVTAFVSHMISKASDEAGDRRLAEAVYIQKVIADYIAQHPDRFVVFGGDLNDDPDSAPIKALEIDGVLLRDTRNMSETQIRTWRNISAFDHLYHNALFDSNYRETERFCGASPSIGLSSSDHCGLRSTYEF